MGVGVPQVPYLRWSWNDVVTGVSEGEVEREIKKGKLLISHRYNRIPLLASAPGGFCRSWSYKTYPSAKVEKFLQCANGAVKFVFRE